MNIKSSKFLFTTFIAIILLILFYFLFINVEPEINNNINNNESNSYKISNLVFADYNGNDFSFYDGVNKNAKLLIINSWASWCPFCVKELEDFASAQDEFKNEIEIIAINRGENLNKSKEFTDKLGLTQKIKFLLDPQDNFYKSIGGFSMPETVFVDNKTKNILIHKRGVMSKEELLEKINNAFSQINN